MTAKPVLNRAQFHTSVAQLRDLPYSRAEIAFAGRSNAGKSSAINRLTRKNRLAFTSKTPGRTQLINFFELDADTYLVDLPGYGYAKVSHSMKEEWQRHLGEYLQGRQSLRGLILLMDIRHPLTDFDQNMLAWAAERHLAVHCVLTKADKLNRGPALNVLQSVRKELQALGFDCTAQLFSALKMEGLEALGDKLGEWLDYPPGPELPVEAHARLA